MAMDKGAEGQAVLERQMEVLHVDVLVWGRFALAPQEQTLLRRHLLDGYILDGEAENDRPDHSQCHLQVTIDDFWGERRDRYRKHTSDPIRASRYN